ncbi:hypothetical protein [Methanofollis ethanolicus]|uniref:hypothetical protein n=1 Tax=Methanofollis ethanolicus TaxID=488124 RepID=UPI00083141C6|nr:hypothetical protein [Methanofollis ethanolicus]
MQPQSGIARPLDLSYQTNRIIVLLALATFLVSAAASTLAGTGIVETLILGSGAALAVFLAWALCREADPDHDLSALLAAVMTTGALVVLPIPDILTLLWALLVIRVVPPRRPTVSSSSSSPCGPCHGAFSLRAPSPPRHSSSTAD